MVRRPPRRWRAAARRSTKAVCVFFSGLPGGDEDPDAVEASGAAGGLDDMGVARMRRIERAAHDADGEIARRRGEAQVRAGGGVSCGKLAMRIKRRHPRA
jgi:hypothetical protein